MYALLLWFYTKLLLSFLEEKKSSENVEHLQSNNAGTKICHSIITLYTYIDFKGLSMPLSTDVV